MNKLRKYGQYLMGVNGNKAKLVKVNKDGALLTQLTGSIVLLEEVKDINVIAGMSLTVTSLLDLGDYTHVSVAALRANSHNYSLSVIWCRETGSTFSSTPLGPSTSSNFSAPPISLRTKKIRVSVRNESETDQLYTFVTVYGIK